MKQELQDMVDMFVDGANGGDWSNFYPEQVPEVIAARKAIENSDSLVLRITTAYEQGFGHALRTELDNPYQEGTLEAEAWDTGREVGKRKQFEPTDPYLKTVFAELYAQDSRQINPKWKPNEIADCVLQDLHNLLKLVYFAGRNSK